MKIIIVGAGIAGLTLAAACQKVGIQVKVYEKTKQLQNIGGGLLLWPHGIRYLEWLGLSECLNPFHLPIKKCKMTNAQGQQIFSEEYAPFCSLLGGNMLPIERHLLQQALLNQLTDDVVILGKECIDIQTEANRARIFFADGTQDDADLVVGADGIHSMIRKCLFEKTDLLYTGYCWWGGIVEQKYVPNLSPDEVLSTVNVGKMCIIWPVQGNKYMWYLPVKMPMSDLARGDDGLLQLQTLCADWNDHVQQIISAPTSAQRFHLPIYTVSPQSRISTSCITLIGDAAHAIGPILGQGTNLAIEDIFVLINCLQDKENNIEKALKDYEALRVERVQRLFELENQTAAVMIGDDHEALAAFEQQIQSLSLEAIYQDLIPLVNEHACLAFAEAVNFNGSTRVCLQLECALQKQRKMPKSSWNMLRHSEIH